MSNRPESGDRIEMPFMGDDVDIKVSSVPAAQPLEAGWGIVLVYDQYGEEHLVEKDRGSWVTIPVSSLSEDAFWAYGRGDSKAPRSGFRL